MQHPRGAKISCHTTGVASDKTLKKKSGAHLGLVLQRAESFLQELWWCGGRSWAGLAGQAGLRFAQGALEPGRRARTLLHRPPWHLGEQKAGIQSCYSSPGCQLERPGRLSEPQDGKQTVCIGLLRLGCLGIRGGKMTRLGIVHPYHLLICSAPHLIGNSSGTSACLISGWGS